MASRSSQRLKQLLAGGEDGQAGDRDEDDDVAGLRELAIDVDLQPIELTKEEEQNLAKSKAGQPGAKDSEPRGRADADGAREHSPDILASLTKQGDNEDGSAM